MAPEGNANRVQRAARSGARGVVQRIPAERLEQLRTLCERIVENRAEDTIFIGMGGSPEIVVQYLAHVMGRDAFSMPLSNHNPRHEYAPEQLHEGELMLRDRAGGLFDKMREADIVLIDVAATGRSIVAGVNFLRAVLASLDADHDAGRISAFAIGNDDLSDAPEHIAREFRPGGSVTLHPGKGMRSKARDGTPQDIAEWLISGFYKQYRSVGVFKPQEGDSYEGYHAREAALMEGQGDVGGLEEVASRSPRSEQMALVQQARSRAQALTRFLSDDERKPEGIDDDTYITMEELKKGSMKSKAVTHKEGEEAFRNADVARAVGNVPAGGAEMEPVALPQQAPAGRVRRRRKCYITSACVEVRGLADDCTELCELRAFRDGWLRSQPNGKTLIDDYYRGAPNIVRYLKAQPDATRRFNEIFESVILPCLAAIREGRYEVALLAYEGMVRSLQAEAAANAVATATPKARATSKAKSVRRCLVSHCGSPSSAQMRRASAVD